MNVVFSKRVMVSVLGLLLYSLAGHADDLVDDDAVGFQLSYPVLDSAATTELPFPYLLPEPETPQVYPPLLVPPEILAAPELSLSDMASGPVLEMDVSPAPPDIAVIIDDVGYNRRGMEASLALPVAVAMAILPSTPYGARAAKAAAKQQRVTMLHAPMENDQGLKLGPGGLYLHMDEQAFKQTLRQDLDTLVNVRGVNNHTGSLLTIHIQPMEWVMDVLSERSLFFIDSLTTADSVAYQIAQERGIQSSTRDVFLDNVRTEEAINHQFERLLKLAHQKGQAIAIGHPYPETMAYLTRRLSQPLSVQLQGVESLL